MTTMMAKKSHEQYEKVSGKNIQSIAWLKSEFQIFVVTALSTEVLSSKTISPTYRATKTQVTGD